MKRFLRNLFSLLFVALAVAILSIAGYPIPEAVSPIERRLMALGLSEIPAILVEVAGVVVCVVIASYLFLRNPFRRSKLVGYKDGHLRSAEVFAYASGGVQDEDEGWAMSEHIHGCERCSDQVETERRIQREFVKLVPQRRNGNARMD